MPLKVNPTPTGSNFGQLYDAVNGNADELIVAANPNRNIIELQQLNGNTFVIPLTIGENRPVSGLTPSITGAGPYDVTLTAGVYQVEARQYSYAGGLTPIPVAGPDPRIDSVWGDTFSVVGLTSGTPAANPTPPTLFPTQAELARVYVPPAGAPVLIQTGGETLPPGNTAGDILQWNGAEWIAAPQQQMTQRFAIRNLDGIGPVAVPQAIVTLDHPAGGRFIPTAIYTHLTALTATTVSAEPVIDVGTVAGSYTDLFTGSADIDVLHEYRSLGPSGSTSFADGEVLFYQLNTPATGTGISVFTFDLFLEGFYA